MTDTADLTHAQVGDTLVLRCGGRDKIKERNEYEIYGTYSAMWELNGESAYSTSFDCIALEKRPELIEGFANVYSSPGILGNYSFWANKEDADKSADKSRIACIKLTYDPTTRTATAEVVG